MKNHNFNIWITEGLFFSLTTCRWSSEIISRPIVSQNKLSKNLKFLPQNMGLTSWKNVNMATM